MALGGSKSWRLARVGDVVAATLGRVPAGRSWALAGSRSRTGGGTFDQAAPQHSGGLRHSSGFRVPHGWLLAVAVTLLLPVVSFAADAPKRELWAGAGHASDHWTVYSGATIAPFGTLLTPGLRLRAQAGLSSFSYSGLRHDDATNRAVTRSFRGTTSFGDVLVGWQGQWGTFTVKAFGGGTYRAQAITPFDDVASGYGQRWSHKVAVETWWDFSRQVWLALDGQMTGLDRERGVTARLGYRISDTLSLGVMGRHATSEIATDRDAGGFVRFDNGRMELSVTGTVPLSDEHASRWQISGQVMVRF